MSEEDFLARGPAQGWRRQPLAGDASSRRYERLTGPDGRTAILMVSPPAEDAALGAFLSIAAHLREAGLAAPRLLDLDRGRGLALFEDLGETDVASALRADPGHEPVVTEAVGEVLVRLDRLAPPQGLARLDPRVGGEMLAPLVAYAPDVDLAALSAAVSEALARHCGPPTVLSLRDFHGENLIWRPGRAGVDRLGLLDFQDAVLAPPGYDLASYVSDVRRDVPPEVRGRLVGTLAAGADPVALDEAVSVLSVQRNLRILGIFANLARTKGKRRYLAFLPRLWETLQRDLERPVLDGVRSAARDLPDPAAATRALERA